MYPYISYLPWQLQPVKHCSLSALPFLTYRKFLHCLLSIEHASMFDWRVDLVCVCLCVSVHLNFDQSTLIILPNLFLAKLEFSLTKRLTLVAMKSLCTQSTPAIGPTINLFTNSARGRGDVKISSLVDQLWILTCAVWVCYDPTQMPRSVMTAVTPRTNHVLLL